MNKKTLPMPKSLRILLLAGFAFAFILLASVSTQKATASTVVDGKLTLNNGKALLFAGQNIEDVNDYTIRVHNGASRNGAMPPIGVTAYVAINGTGVYSHVDDPNGSLDLQAYLANGYKNSALAVGTWMVDLEEDFADQIDAGQGPILDHVHNLLEELKASNRPVYLRWGYEVDGPWNHYEPAAFIKGWRYVHGWIEANDAHNIAMVWQIAAYCDSPDDRVIPDANTYGGRTYEAWWPDDDYVDWTGFSYFSQNEDCKTANDNIGGLPNGFGELSDMQGNQNQALHNVMAYLNSKGKPVMIAEATPRFYDIGDLRYKSSFDINQADFVSKTAQEIWDEWFDPFLDFVDEYEDSIRAVAYINSEWEKYDGWNCIPGPTPVGCSQNYWGDSRVDANSLIKTNWTMRTRMSGRFETQPHPYIAWMPKLIGWDNFTPVPVTNKAYSEQHLPHALIGRIEAEQFDVGGQGLAYHDVIRESRHNWFNKPCRNNERVFTHEGGSGNCFTHNYATEWMKYSVNVPGTATQTYEIKLALARSSSNPGVVKLYIDDILQDTYSVAQTGGWNVFQEYTTQGINIAPGNHTIKVEFASNTTGFDYMTFTPSDPSAFTSPYDGTPFPLPSSGSDTLEIEHFDIGTEGGAFYDLTPATYHNHDANCRNTNAGGEDVNIATGGSNCYVNYTLENEWLNYTIEVPTSGNYDITVWAAHGANWNSDATFRIAIPTANNYVSSDVVTPSQGWNMQAATINNVPLNAGVHTLRLEITGQTPGTAGHAGNYDRIVFTKN